MEPAWNNKKNKNGKVYNFTLTEKQRCCKW